MLKWIIKHIKKNLKEKIMKNKELIEKILKIIEEVSEDNTKIPKEAQESYQLLCKMIAIKIMEKLGSEEL